MMRKFKLYKIISTTVYFFLSTVFAFAQDIQVKASINKNQIEIGDAVKLNLSATFNPTQAKVQFPYVSDTFNHFEVIEKAKLDTVNTKEKNTITQTIIISNYDSGLWKIPSYSFQILPLQGGVPYTMSSDSLFVKVNTIVVDTSKPFMPIMAIREAKMPTKIIVMYVIAVIFGLAILGLLIWYGVKKFREKNNKDKVKIQEIKLLPHDKAMQNLVQLEAQNLWQAGQEKIYHTLLTDTIRTYLEEQFNMDVFEKTSSELMQQIKKQKALSNSRQALRTIFETADLVKFAKNKPTEEEHLKSMELAKEMVLESYKKYLNRIKTNEQLRVNNE
jgi:hypothetical protein